MRRRVFLLRPGNRRIRPADLANTADSISSVSVAYGILQSAPTLAAAVEKMQWGFSFRAREKAAFGENDTKKRLFAADICGAVATGLLRVFIIKAKKESLEIQWFQGFFVGDPSGILNP